jgi:hypothetical protein
MGKVRAAILPLDDKRLCWPGIGLAGGTMPGLENPLSGDLFAIRVRVAVAYVQAFGLKAAAHASSMFSTPGISADLPARLEGEVEWISKTV